MKLDGAAVILTGASGGIGRSLALELAQHGACLYLISRSEKELNETAEMARNNGAAAVYIRIADVTVEVECALAVSDAALQMGRLDILVNNAGVGYYGPLETMPDSEIERLYRTNVLGVLHMVRPAVSYLRKSRGLIVNISSGLSFRALPFLSAYGGTKAMLNQLSDGLRMELMKDHVRVLNYCPPMTDTPFMENSQRDTSMVFERSKLKMKSPSAVAQDIVKCIIKGRRDGGDRSLFWMNAFAASFADRLFARVMAGSRRS